MNHKKRKNSLRKVVRPYIDLLANANTKGFEPVKHDPDMHLNNAVVLLLFAGYDVTTLRENVKNVKEFHTLINAISTVIVGMSKLPDWRKKRVEEWARSQDKPFIILDNSRKPLILMYEEEGLINERFH